MPPPIRRFPTSDAAVIATVFAGRRNHHPVPTDFADPFSTTMRTIDGWTRFTALHVEAASTKRRIRWTPD